MEGKAALIRAQIKKKYKNVRRFAIAMNMPYSTIAAALDKGDQRIDTMAYGTVLAICGKLDLDPISFLPVSDHEEESTPQERMLMSIFEELNEHGKERILEMAEDMKFLDKYTK